MTHNPNENSTSKNTQLSQLTHSQRLTKTQIQPQIHPKPLETLCFQNIRWFQISSQITGNAYHITSILSILSTTYIIYSIHMHFGNQRNTCESTPTPSSKNKTRWKSFTNPSLHPPYLIQFHALAINPLHLRPPNAHVNHKSLHVTTSQYFEAHL